MSVTRFLLLALVVLGACAPPVKKGTGFFAFDSLLQAQAEELALQRATVSKHVTMHGKTDTVLLSPKDSTAWYQELELFSQLEAINSPQNSIRYTATTYADESSNLTVRELAAQESLPVQRVKIFYLQEPTTLRKIEATIRHQNALYQSAQQLTLIFTDVHTKTTLTTYSIEGGQHMVLGDTVQFSSTGTIRIH
jgi:hypothetical protein